MVNSIIENPHSNNLYDILGICRQVPTASVLSCLSENNRVSFPVENFFMFSRKVSTSDDQEICTCLSLPVCGSYNVLLAQMT